MRSAPSFRAIPTKMHGLKRKHGPSRGTKRTKRPSLQPSMMLVSDVGPKCPERFSQICFFGEKRSCRMRMLFGWHTGPWQNEAANQKTKA